VTQERRGDRIARKKDGDLEPIERQELRYIADQTLYEDKFSIERLGETQKKVDDLWRIFGWLADTVRNRKAILVALGVALFVGGREMIENIADKLGSFLQ